MLFSNKVGIVRKARLSIRGDEMGKECYVCAKKTISGNTVSHSNIHTKRKWLPNLRKVRIVEEGSNKTVTVCTRCLRSGKVERV